MKPGACQDTIVAEVFNDNFVHDFKEELKRFNAMHDNPKEISLKSLNFELEMLSIVNFYITNPLCYVRHGTDKDYSNGTFVLHQLSPGDYLQFNDGFGYTELNIHIPLGQRKKDYEGAGLNFVRYNCSTEDLSPGTFLMFPPDLTHFYTNNKITSGVFTFLTIKMHYTTWICYQKANLYVCPGFGNKNNL